MDAIPWQMPWVPVAEPERTLLERQLKRELPPGHVLEGRRARALGRRVDTDDVVFLLDDRGVELAVVHLTWRDGRERSAAWPHTVVFGDIREFVEGCLQRDREDSERRPEPSEPAEDDSR
jgi:hypothetical protein